MTTCADFDDKEIHLQSFPDESVIYLQSNDVKPLRMLINSNMTLESFLPNLLNFDIAGNNRKLFLQKPHILPVRNHMQASILVRFS